MDSTAAAPPPSSGAPPTSNPPAFGQSPSATERPSGGGVGDFPPEGAEKKSSSLGTYANLCNITLGAGIVGLPYAIKEAGLVAGTVMIIVCAVLTDYSLRSVISTGKLANVRSYEALMEAAFGRPGFLFVSLSMFFLSYGSMVAYLLIIKDTLPILFGVDPDDDSMKRAVMFAGSLLVILPLSMQRDMANLERTSSLNVLINACLVALVVASSPVRESVRARGGLLRMISDEPFLDVGTFFVGFGVCSFAFVCQDSSFIIAGSMEAPSRRRWKRVTNGAMLTCCTLDLTLGVAGYLAYQSDTKGNVLNNVESRHWGGAASRAMLSTTMFFAYPLNLHVARHALAALSPGGDAARRLLDGTTWPTCALYLLSLVPATLMGSTGRVLAVTGTVAGSGLAYIVPGLTFLAIRGDVLVELVRGRWGESRGLWGYPPDPVAKNGAGLALETGDERPVTEATPLDSFLWYALGIPVWSAIARFGQTKLAEHFEKEGTTSPGAMKPRRASPTMPTRRPAVPRNGGDADGIERTALLKTNPGCSYGADSLASSEDELESEEEIPTWRDFRIAIAYVCLGVVAMVLGLISILML